MKKYFIILFFLLEFVNLKGQEILLNENFQNWNPQPIAKFLYPPINKKLSNGQSGIFRGSMFSVFPNRDAEYEGMEAENTHSTNGCLALSFNGAFLQLPDLISIGRLSINANSFTDQSSFKLQVFNSHNWVDIPGTQTKLAKNVIKQFTYDLNFPSNTTIRIYSNQNDSIKIWDIQVSSYSSKIPRLKTPENVSVSNKQSTGFQMNWTPVENANGYEVRLYNNTGIVKVINLDGQQTHHLPVGDLLSGIKYSYSVISKGNNITYTDSYAKSDTLDFVLPNQSAKTGPKIIFKFDDIHVNKGYCASMPTIKYLASEKIKASYGVIAAICDSTSDDLFNPYLNMLNDDGDNLIEIWNHGYDHKTFNSLPEFRGTGYTYQKTHLENADQQVLKNFGIQMTTLGTPWNESDTVTNRVMSENPNYKVFLCTQGQPVPAISSGILALNHFVYMEYDTGKPDFNVFLYNYNFWKEKYPDYMVIQGHPNFWDPNSPYLPELKRIIEFLKNQGCDFVLPYEYYISQALLPPSDLKSYYDNGKKIKLLWKNNSDLEDFTKVERSTDLKNWKVRGVCNKDSVSFTDTDVSTDTVSYFYRISAIKKNQSKYSSILQVNITNTNLIDSNLYYNHIKIYPNPCKQDIRIQFDMKTPETVRCDIYNAQGELIKNLFDENFSQGISNHPYSLNLEPGVYYCRFYTGYNTYSSKLIVSD